MNFPILSKTVNMPLNILKELVMKLFSNLLKYISFCHIVLSVSHSLDKTKKNIRSYMKSFIHIICSLILICAEIDASTLNIQNPNDTIFVATRLPDNRDSSAPYLSGDTFRAYADFVIDETNIPFSPNDVTPCSTIFLKSDYMSRFFSDIHPLISHPYILITHNSDDPAPGAYADVLEDDKLIAWFAQNVEGCVHPKLHPIPIGIANKYWAHGDTELLDQMRAHLEDYTKNVLLYMNFSVNPAYAHKGAVAERSMIYHQFLKADYCMTAYPKDFQSYLTDLARSKFVLSPRGNGVDCHRTWEALYMGAIPIVRTSELDVLYEGLPVIIINDWNEVTQSFLEEKFESMCNQPYQWEKLTAEYWYKLIDKYKRT